MSTLLLDVLKTTSRPEVAEMAIAAAILLGDLLGGRIAWGWVERDDGQSVVVWDRSDTGELVAFTDTEDGQHVAILDGSRRASGRTLQDALRAFIVDLKGHNAMRKLTGAATWP